MDDWISSNDDELAEGGSHSDRDGGGSLGHAEALRQLREQLDAVRDDIRQLNARLGAAALRNNAEDVVESELRLEMLLARETGLAAEIDHLQRMNVSVGGRAQRREDAAAQVRLELAAATREIYEGWSALLDQRARLIELTDEIERLRTLPVVDSTRLDSLRRRLDEVGEHLDLRFHELEGDSDALTLREAACYYAELARADDGPLARTAADSACDDRSPFESPTVELASISGAVADPGSADPGPEQEVRTVDSGQRTGADDEAFRDLDASEQRLKALRVTLQERGDPMGVAAEVEAQLAAIEDSRQALLQTTGPGQVREPLNNQSSSAGQTS